MVTDRHTGTAFLRRQASPPRWASRPGQSDNGLKWSRHVFFSGETGGRGLRWRRNSFHCTALTPSHPRPPVLPLYSTAALAPALDAGPVGGRTPWHDTPSPRSRVAPGPRVSLSTIKRYVLSSGHL